MFFPVCQSKWQLSGTGMLCHGLAFRQCAVAFFPLLFLGPYCETVLPLGPSGTWERNGVNAPMDQGMRVGAPAESLGWWCGESSDLDLSMIPGAGIGCLCSLPDPDEVALSAQYKCYFFSSFSSPDSWWM